MRDERQVEMEKMTAENMDIPPERRQYIKNLLNESRRQSYAIMKQE
jgi:hypothetical protein